MAATGPIVVQTGSGIEVKGRRRLGDADKFDAMLEELVAKVQEKATEEKGALIADLDVSQNNLAFEQFEALFTQLGANNARVQRFRMFGCPTLDDNVVRVFADYLRMLTGESAPSEMHLSDCAITTQGWDFLISAIEETELYPVSGPFGGPARPLYLRLENNYIAEESIKEKMDAGIVRAYAKNNSFQKPQAEGSIKVNLVVKPDGSIQQRQGEPPNPQDAPAPKQVWDKQTLEGQGWGGKAAAAGKGAAASPWNGGGGAWAGGAWAGGCSGKGKGAMVRPMTPGHFGAKGMQALPAAGYGGMARAGIVRPAASIIRPVVTATIKPAQGGGCGGKGMAGGFNAFNAFGSAGVQRMVTPASAMSAATASVWPRGTSGGAVDRSRTPVARTAAPQQPAKPPPRKGSDLPYPWEEQWSEEYQIPYFWNSETGDSLWEKPTA